jgi:hypothetical protein
MGRRPDYPKRALTEKADDNTLYLCTLTRERIMKRLVSLTVLSLTLLGAAACSDSAAPGTGLTQVVLTDDPFPTNAVRSVEVYIVSVAVSPSGDTLLSPSDWITVAEPHKRFDLLTLQNGTTALLGETQLAAGAYHLVRIVLNTDSSSITWADGHKASVHWGFPGEISIHPIVEQPLGISPQGGHIEIDFNVALSFPYNVIQGYEFDFLPWIQAIEASGT